MDNADCEVAIATDIAAIATERQQKVLLKNVTSKNIEKSHVTKYFTPRNDDNYGIDASWTSAADSLCNMDPSRIILENVGRNFHGNYSCQVGILQPL